MKKKILFLLMLPVMLFSYVIPCSAADILSVSSENKSGFKIDLFFRNFIGSTSAVVAAAITLVVVLLFFVFRKKLSNKLSNSTASQMINAFIVFFSVGGLASLFMAFATDGATWSNMMYTSQSSNMMPTHFSDYIITIQNAGTQRFVDSADSFTPFSMLIYFIIAQFLPTKLVFTQGMLSYTLILKNQTFMYLYLLLVVFCIVLIYRMNRSVLRRNELKARDELVVFLTVVSYPTIYCIERGNVICLSLALTMFFLLFNSSQKKVLRELSHAALGISAAITPLTLLFAFLMIDDDKKKSLFGICKITVFFLVFLIAPCVFTGFDCLLVYFKNFVSVSEQVFIPGNMSIANLLLFFGVKNNIVLGVVTILTDVIALLCLITLPSAWMKMTAAVYIMLNLFSFSTPMALIFVFVPFVFMLSEKNHKSVDWLYLLAYALLITPFPEWFYSDQARFGLFMNTVGIKDIGNANNLISLAAAQGLFILLFYQMIKRMQNKKIKIQSDEKN